MLSDHASHAACLAPKHLLFHPFHVVLHSMFAMQCWLCKAATQLCLSICFSNTFCIGCTVQAGHATALKLLGWRQHDACPSSLAVMIGSCGFVHASSYDVTALQISVTRKWHMQHMPTVYLLFLNVCLAVVPASFLCVNTNAYPVHTVLFCVELRTAPCCAPSELCSSLVLSKSCQGVLSSCEAGGRWFQL